MGDASTMDSQIFQGSEIVRTETRAGLHESCDQCTVSIATTARRRSNRRRFCSTRCRSRWHRERRAALQAEASRLLERCAIIVEELAGKQ
jgi:hypothetical protein